VLVTLVTTEKNRFQESLKACKTVRSSSGNKFQTVEPRDKKPERQTDGQTDGQTSSSHKVNFQYVGEV